MKPIDPKNLMALERSTASLIGVAISFIVLGFVVEKFELFLQIVAAELQGKGTALPKTVKNAAFYDYLGIGIVGAGILLALYTVFYYGRWIELLKKGKVETDRKVFTLIALFVVAVGVALMGSMILF